MTGKLTTLTAAAALVAAMFTLPAATAGADETEHLLLFTWECFTNTQGNQHEAVTQFNATFMMQGSVQAYSMQDTTREQDAGVLCARPWNGSNCPNRSLALKELIEGEDACSAVIADEKGPTTPQFKRLRVVCRDKKINDLLDVLQDVCESVNNN